MKHFLLLLFFFPLILSSQNKLKNAKKNIRTNNTKSGKKNIRTSNNSNADYSRNYDWFEYTGFSELLFELTLRASLGVFIGEIERKELNPYPYYYDNEGEYAKELSDTGRRQNLKLGLNYLPNNISGFDINALYKPLPILGIYTSHTHFTEKNITGNDFLDITNLSLNYYRIREKDFVLWWGIGATYIGNNIDKLGASYNIGTEIYPFKPISLHFSWQESYVNERQIGVFKSQLKYHKKEKTFFVGYHTYQITNQVIKSPSIGFEVTL